MFKHLFKLLLIFTLIVSPAFAAYCHHCGKTLPEQANFCPACGKPAAAAFETAPGAQAGEVSQKHQNQPTIVESSASFSQDFSQNSTPSSLAEYDFINQLELLLTDAGYETASRQAKEIKAQNSLHMNKLLGNYRSYNAYQRKLNDLHAKKLKALDTYFDAWKRSEYGPDKVQAAAEKDRSLFIISKLNEALDKLLSGGNNLASIAEVEKMETRVYKTSKDFRVTSAYLLVNNQRLNRNEPFWVIDVSGANAQILHMGRAQYSEPVSGWISVYDLEKRSNWRSDPDFFYSSTPPPAYTFERPQTEVKVVVYERKPYHWRHYPWGKRYPQKRRYPEKKRYPHRHYGYLVVEPKFW